MVFIPNEGDATHGEQAELDSVDFDIILDGFKGRGVKTGCAVSANGTGLAVDVAAGTIYYDGVEVAVSASPGLALGAAGSQLHFDLVVVSSGGAVSVVDGTAFYSATYGPELPNYTNSVVLAVVTTPANHTTTVAGDILDRRILLSSTLFAGVTDHGTLTGLSDDDHPQYTTDAEATVIAAILDAAHVAAGDPHTQYVLRSILTTNGDLFTRTAGVIARLGVGSNTDVLSVVGGLPAYVSVGTLAGTLDHGTLLGLTDDDHTQYALLAGRAASQTLIGGTGIGGGLTLKSTSNVTKGNITVSETNNLMLHLGNITADFFISGGTDTPNFSVDSTDYFNFTRATNLFAWGIGNADQFQIDAAGVRALNYLRVGSLTAPTNNTAGDLTVTRLAVGNDAAFGSASGYFAKFVGTFTDTSSGAKIGFQFNPTISPATDSSAEFRVLNMSATVSTSDVALGTVSSLVAEIDYRGLNPGATGDVTAVLRTMSLSGLVLRSTNDARQAVTAATSLLVTAYSRPSGTGTVSVTDMLGITIAGPTSAGATVGTYTGMNITNPGASFTPTTAIAIDLEKFTRGTTNINFRNAGINVWTPTAHAAITAANTTLTVTSRIMTITANASYTLVGAGGVGPTIADGQDGQLLTIINVDTADTITFQDQGTLAASNLRLSAATVALAPRGSMTLIFLSAVGDWVELAALAVI